MADPRRRFLEGCTEGRPGQARNKAHKQTFHPALKPTLHPAGNEALYDAIEQAGLQAQSAIDQPERSEPGAPVPRNRPFTGNGKAHAKQGWWPQALTATEE